MITFDIIVNTNINVEIKLPLDNAGLDYIEKRYHFLSSVFSHLNRIIFYKSQYI